MNNTGRGKEWSDEQIDAYLAGIDESDYPRVFWQMIRKRYSEAQSLIDIGCGPGAFALAAAADGLNVQAVDINRKNLEALTREAKRRDLHGIIPIRGRWPAVTAEPADLAVCAYSFGGEVGTGEGISAILRTALKAAFFICPFEKEQTDFLSKPLYEEAGLTPPTFSGSYQDILAIFEGLKEKVNYHTVRYDFGMPLPETQTLEWCAGFLADKLGLPSAEPVKAHLQKISVRKNNRLWIPNPRKSVIITWKKSEN